MFMAVVMTACLAVSCQKEKEEELPVFTAHADNGGMKTDLVGNFIVWNNTDQVKVFGDFGYAIYGVTPRGDDPTWATLTPMQNQGITGFLPYRFVYPASMAEGGASNNNTLYVNYPAERNINDAPLKYFPMYGESDHRDVVFRNLGGLIKIHFSEGCTDRVRHIRVTANENFVGRYIVNPTTGDLEFVSGPYKDYVDDYNHRTLPGNELMCKFNNSSIAQNSDMWVSLPAGDYSGLTLEIIRENSDTCVKSFGESVVVTVRKSQITTINISSEIVFDREYEPTTYLLYDDEWPEYGWQELSLPQFVDLGLPSGTKWSSAIPYPLFPGINPSLGNFDFRCDYIGFPSRAQVEELIENCTISIRPGERGTANLIFTSNINNNSILMRRTVEHDCMNDIGMDEFWERYPLLGIAFGRIYSMCCKNADVLGGLGLAAWVEILSADCDKIEDCQFGLTHEFYDHGEDSYYDVCHVFSEPYPILGPLYTSQSWHLDAYRTHYSQTRMPNILFVKTR